jgi:1-acyl-sn-glycerol-3-phosphate acyltransferase
VQLFRFLISPARAGRVASLKQLVRIGLAGLAFTGFGLGAVLLAWVLLPLLSLTGTRAGRRRRCQRAVRAAFVFFHDYMRVTGLVDFDPRSIADRLPSEPVVVVANHPTLVDVTAMVAAFGEVCVVAKSAWFRNPLLGPLFHCCGYIDSQGSNDTGEGVALLEAGTQRLQEGHSVLLFPEGTRSPAEGMHRFRSGAFHLAARARVPVLPVLVTAYPSALKKHQAWYAIPTRAIRLRLHVLEAVQVSDRDEPRSLQLAVRDRITRALAAL